MRPRKSREPSSAPSPRWGTVVRDSADRLRTGRRVQETQRVTVPPPDPTDDSASRPIGESAPGAHAPNPSGARTGGEPRRSSDAAPRGGGAPTAADPTADGVDGLDDAPIGVHWAAADGTILRANRAELDLLGFRRDAYVGRNLREFHVDPARAEEFLAQLARGESPRNFVARLRTRDGETLHVRIGATGRWSEGRLVEFRCVTQDDTQRVLAERALRESEERFRLMVDGAQDYAIHTLSPDGRVTSWNAGAQRLHGFTADEIMGADLACLYVPADRANRLPERLLREASEKGESHYEGWRLRKDGSRFWADSVITAFRDDHGRLRGFARLARDVTERMRMEETRRRGAEIEAENRRLLDAWRLQAEFLASMSRELKTPLGAALAASERLRDESEGPLAAGQRHAVEDIASGLRHVLRTFDEVLGVVRIDAGRVELRPERVNLTRLAQDVRDVLRAHAAEKRVRVELEFEAADAEVEGDPTLLKLVFHNLLRDAIRSAWPDGLVPVIVSAEGPDALRIEVLDDGPERSSGAPARSGAASADGEDAGSDEAAVADLRAAVTKRIVEAHGGRVGTWEAANGARVDFVVLPRTAGRSAADLVEPEDETGVAAEGRSILVVDDDAASRAWLRWTLSSAGWSVVAPTGGAEARAVAAERGFDAIAVSLLLRTDDAAVLVRDLRATAPMRGEVPVVATVPGEADGVAGVRIDDLIGRPVATEVLFASLDRLGVPACTASTVLVVESDPDVRGAALRSLEALGYAAVGAEGAEDGLRAAAHASPSAVILGVDPASGGFHFLRHFRRSEERVAVPVILCSPSSATPEEAREIRSAVQNDVLVCPGGRAAILRELDAVARQAGRSSGGGAGASRRAPPQAELP